MCADRVRTATLEIAHPNAAGIDIGSASHFVAVRPDLHEKSVREFAAFTEDLESLARKRSARAHSAGLA